MEKDRKVRRPSAPYREPQGSSTPEVMDIRSVSKYLGMGKSKIYALIRLKKIPASRIGRQYRFSKEIIDHWLKEKLITKSEESQMSLSFGTKSEETPRRDVEKKPETEINREEPHASS